MGTADLCNANKQNSNSNVHCLILWLYQTSGVWLQVVPRYRYIFGLIIRQHDRWKRSGKLEISPLRVQCRRQDLPDTLRDCRSLNREFHFMMGIRNYCAIRVSCENKVTIYNDQCLILYFVDRASCNDSW